MLGGDGTPSGPAEEPVADTETGDSPAQAGEPPSTATPRMPETCAKMDVVFVVDDSPSMREEQDNLAANLPQFVQVLDEYLVDDTRPLDYRLAVLTPGRDVQEYIASSGTTYPAQASTGDNGAFRQLCGMPRPWIERGDADVAGTFSCVAQVGVEGSAKEMPLEALRMAFDERQADGTNAGFLRDDALLAVVILTDEDDCSTMGGSYTIMGSTQQPPAGKACAPAPMELVAVSEYAQLLDTLKSGPGRWAVASIAGPGPGTCTSPFGDALHAERLQELTQLKGDNAVFSSVCDGDLSSALRDALDTFDQACRAFPVPI